MTYQSKGRRPGTVVTYSAQQTERYKSQWIRYEGAQQLLRNRDLIYNANGVKRFRSKRSPVGYWEVKKKLYGSKFKVTGFINAVNQTGVEPASIDLQLTYDPVFDPSPGDFIIEIVTPDGDPEKKDISIQYKQKTIINEIDDTDEDPPRLVIETFTTHYFLVSIINPGTARWQQISYNVPRTQLTIVGVDASVTELNGNWTRENLTVVGYKFEDYIYGQLFNFNDIQFPPHKEISIDPIDGEKFLECSCPDFKKEVKANSNSPYLSERGDRSWTESDAGAPDPPRECKHLIAAKILDDEFDLIQFKLDYPYPYPYATTGRTAAQVKRANSQNKNKNRRITDQPDLGQEVWVGGKRSGLYEGSQGDIDLGYEDLDSPAELIGVDGMGATYDSKLANKNNAENFTARDTDSLSDLGDD